MTHDDILHRARIFIVDDELSNVRYLEIILQQAGYLNVSSTTDARKALPFFQEWQPDIVLLDLNMPYLSGFEVMQQLRAQIGEETYLPILVLTADVSAHVKRKALSEGAKDFLSKPLDATEVLLRIHNLLQARFQNQILEAMVQERTYDLVLAQRETLQRLAIAAEYRDDDTGLHTRRVGDMAALIAQNLGLTQPTIELLRQTAPLHDVGKIGVSDTLLLKPGKLTKEEFEVIKQHTIIGGKILSHSKSSWLQSAEEIALCHHERWDGTGYPQGLSGEEIPVEGRIVAVADVFDALTHARPYKQAWPVIDAVNEIKKQRGAQFDPRIADAFLLLDHETLL